MIAVPQTVVICKIQLHKWDFISRIKKIIFTFQFINRKWLFLKFADIPTNISLARIKYQNRVNVKLTPEKWLQNRTHMKKYMMQREQQKVIQKSQNALSRIHNMSMKTHEPVTLSTLLTSATDKATYTYHKLWRVSTSRRRNKRPWFLVATELHKIRFIAHDFSPFLFNLGLIRLSFVPLWIPRFRFQNAARIA